MSALAASKIAVIGGGINGLMSAWALSSRGAQVELFEKNKLLAATSSSSSRMLHGGIRYLENFQFGFVREALEERAWWHENAPDCTQIVRFHVPVHASTRRSQWQLRFGTWLYQVLAGSRSLGKSRWFDEKALNEKFPEIRQAGLKGAASYVDLVMDDTALGQWVARRAAESGVVIREGVEISAVSSDGEVEGNGYTGQFDRIVNATGPWAESFAQQIGHQLPVHMTLLKGSHLLLSRKFQGGLLLQVPGEQRVVFVVPFGSDSLLGTTEVPVEFPGSPRVSVQERQYLLDALAAYLEVPKSQLESEVIGEFAGIRPLVSEQTDHGSISRDHQLIEEGRVLHVLGGKWTTSRRLGQEVAEAILGKNAGAVTENIIWSKA